MEDSAHHVSRRVVCVGDVHGNSVELQQLWENLKITLGEEELLAADVIFLGDYCDRGPNTREVLDFLVNVKEERTSLSSKLRTRTETNQSERSDPKKIGQAYFIAGNHDFGMAAFLDVLPTDFSLDKLHLTYNYEYKKGFWHPDYDVELEDDGNPKSKDMHYCGRRWCGERGEDSYFEAFATFDSYDKNWRDNWNTPEGLRKSFRDAVEQYSPKHLEFLKDLLWVAELPVDFLGASKPKEKEKHGPGHQTEADKEAAEIYFVHPAYTKVAKIIAVHAGLANDRPTEQQLLAARRRDIYDVCLHLDGKNLWSRSIIFSCRREVRSLPDELSTSSKRASKTDRPGLAGVVTSLPTSDAVPESVGTAEDEVWPDTILISGHHGSRELAVEGNELRIIFDKSGGRVSKSMPLEALILPDRKIVNSNQSDFCASYNDHR